MGLSPTNAKTILAADPVLSQWAMARAKAVTNKVGKLLINFLPTGKDSAKAWQSPFSLL